MVLEHAKVTGFKEQWALRSTASRCRVVGVDLWVDGSMGEERMIAAARQGAGDTHLRLSAAMEPKTTDGDFSDYVRLRFVARRDDAHVTDEAISELLAGLSGKVSWSQLLKLEEFDGVPAFVPLPRL